MSRNRGKFDPGQEPVNTAEEFDEPTAEDLNYFLGYDPDYDREEYVEDPFEDYKDVFDFKAYLTEIMDKGNKPMVVTEKKDNGVKLYDLAQNEGEDWVVRTFHLSHGKPVYEDMSLYRWDKEEVTIGKNLTVNGDIVKDKNGVESFYEINNEEEMQRYVCVDDKSGVCKKASVFIEIPEDIKVIDMEGYASVSEVAYDKGTILDVTDLCYHRDEISFPTVSKEELESKYDKHDPLSLPFNDVVMLGDYPREDRLQARLSYHAIHGLLHREDFELQKGSRVCEWPDMSDYDDDREVEPNYIEL